MYLSILNKNESNLFLDVALFLSHCDEDFSKEEEKLIKDLCEEMKIDYRNSVLTNFDDAIKKLSNVLNSDLKRMVLLEAFGVAMVDGKIAKSEENSLRQMISVFCLPISDYDEIIKLVKKLYNCYKSFSNYIYKEL